MSRKNLVDGSHAYKERKFQVAEELFRRAAARDPEGATLEGKTAQVFLARTLHSEYIGNRQDKSKAEEAITEYKKALAVNKDDQSSYKAVASLLNDLQRPDEWLVWVTERSHRTDIAPQNRADALYSLAAKQNTCANEITDTPATKKTVKKDGKDAIEFVKPADAADLEKLKGCIAEGTKLIDQAVGLETEAVKNAKNLDVKALTEEQLKENRDLLKPFVSARSYKTILTTQAMRLAEMEGRTDDRDRLKTAAEQAKALFSELNIVVQNIEDEIKARLAAAEEAANANANANKKK